MACIDLLICVRHMSGGHQQQQPSLKQQMQESERRRTAKLDNLFVTDLPEQQPSLQQQMPESERGLGAKPDDLFILIKRIENLEAEMRSIRRHSKLDNLFVTDLPEQQPSLQQQVQEGGWRLIVKAEDLFILTKKIERVEAKMRSIRRHPT